MNAQGRAARFLSRRVLVLGLVATLVATVLGNAPSAAQQPAPGPDLEVERLAGADRFATAAEIAMARFGQADTVYVATGEGFADALAGGPRAAVDGAPILLVQRDQVPTATTAAIDQLGPASIVVLGGEAAVPAAVAEQLSAYGTVRRIEGTNRFETAAAIAADGFDPGVDTVYLATGGNFPDALAGGVAGGVDGGPVLLVSPMGIPAVTQTEIDRLQPGSIAFLGGPAAVPDDVVMELVTDAPVRRLAGADRILTAIEVSGDTHSDGVDVDSVYLATAGNFPDALAAVPAVAGDGAGLLLVGRDCVSWAVRDEVARLAPDRLVIIGGPAAVSDAAAALTPCDEQPPPPSFQVEPAPPIGSLGEIGDSGPRPIATLTLRGWRRHRIRRGRSPGGDRRGRGAAGLPGRQRR